MILSSQILDVVTPHHRTAIPDSKMLPAMFKVHVSMDNRRRLHNWLNEMMDVNPIDATGNKNTSALYILHLII